MTWQYLNTGFGTGKFNMDFDENLTASMIDGKEIQTLRFYGWDPPAISLGYNQNILDINTDLCKENGVDIVRRPTGGRAILHWNELTYSVTMFADGVSVSNVYERISAALVKGLRMMGIDAELEKSQPDFQKLYKNSSSIPCFSSSAKYEIQYQGKKIVGSAQRRYSTKDGREIALQHGSILLGPEHKQLVDYLAVYNEDSIGMMKKDLSEKTIDAENILGRKIDIEEAAEYMKAGFIDEWGIEFVNEMFVKENKELII